LNVRENYLDFNDNYQFISEEEHNFLYKRCDPEKNDVLLRKVGVGARYACVVPSNLPEFSIFVSVALVKCGGKVNPYFLACFINTKYGQEQLLRFNKGIGQPDLHLEDIKRLKVPVFKINFQNKVEEVVKLAHAQRDEIRLLYTEAEQLLLRELGLKDWQPPTKTTAQKNFSDFLATGRLDAETTNLNMMSFMQPFIKMSMTFARFQKYRRSTPVGCNPFIRKMEPWMSSTANIF